MSSRKKNWTQTDGRSRLFRSNPKIFKIFGLVTLLAAHIASPFNLLGGEFTTPALGKITTVKSEEREAARLAHLDPLKDGWDTEEFSREADRQLIRLSAWLRQGLPGQSELPAEIFADRYRGGPLILGDLRSIYDDGTVRVRRGNAKITPPQDRLLSGAAEAQVGFRAALQEVLAAFGEGSLHRVDMKVFQIDHEAGSDTAATKLVVTLVGKAHGGIREQNAAWLVRWVRREKGDSPPQIISIEVVDFEEVTTLSFSAGETILADCTESILGQLPAYQKQLRYGTNHWLARMENRFSVFYFGHHGIALGDINGDGLDDLYVCQPGGLPNRLFFHNADGTVADNSAEARVDLLDYTGSALIVDLDNDGDQDLVVGTLTQLLLFSNDGSGHFDLRVHLPGADRALSLSASDYDEDGDLDLYLCRYFEKRSQEGRYALPLPYHDANNGGTNLLLRNDGNWRFSDATDESGLSHNNSRFSFAASWEDFDNDGDLDLYVANDFGRNNLYRNDRGRFSDIAAAAGVEDISAGMSVAWGDYNRDGWMDLYVSNMFSKAGNRIAYQRRFQSDLSEESRALYRRHARGNSLFENLGNGNFADASVSSGTTLGRWAWASLFADINRDGWEDILVCNGYITGERIDDL